ILGDNTTTTTLSFTPKDSSGNPVKGMSNVTFAVSGVTGTTVGPVTESNGVYTATLKGNAKGTATVTAQANSTTMSSTTVGISNYASFNVAGSTFTGTCSSTAGAKFNIHLEHPGVQAVAVYMGISGSLSTYQQVNVNTDSNGNASGSLTASQVNMIVQQHAGSVVRLIASIYYNSKYDSDKSLPCS
ncbi:Ig-like domain-containing protein, partial [Buttiauxella gaviniae]|uniref:Ig-like domain-containing protein n=1 Tax=Buttiauxella gaviniae TaxID=82990 RepID=UPI000B25ADAF